VRVYSNAPKTSLKVNGKLIGVLADCPDRICVWNGVALSPGANNIIAIGSFSKGDVEDKTQWHLSDAAAKNTFIDCGALVAGTSPDKRFGSDTFFEGGTAQVISGPGTRGRAPAPPSIAGTSSPEVAATYRAGSFTYCVPVADGPHRSPHVRGAVSTSRRPHLRRFRERAEDCGQSGCGSGRGRCADRVSTAFRSECQGWRGDS
jgi:beta-galactosidase